MGLECKARGSESRFAAYVEAITSALGHADRTTPFRSYCAGLLLPGDRKSVEPIAARVQPPGCRQRIGRFITSWQKPNGRTTPCLRRCAPVSCP